VTHDQRLYVDAAWKHRFMSQCVSELQHRIFNSQSMPSYKSIIAFDKKIRDFYVPPSLLVPGFGGAPNPDEQPTTDLTFERHMTYVLKEMSQYSKSLNFPAFFSYSPF
jgi:hypothetical protein